MTKQQRQELRKHNFDPMYWECRKPIPAFSNIVQVGPEYRDISANHVYKVIDFGKLG